MRREDTLGSPQLGRRTSVFILTLTGPSPLLLHWRRRLCLQVNEAWPLIDHVWSCTTLLISACSSLVCLLCPTVPIITTLISYIMYELHASVLTTSTAPPSITTQSGTHLRLLSVPRNVLSLTLLVPFCCLPFFLSPIPLSGSCFGSDSLTPAGAGGMQQLRYTALINNT